MKPGTGQMAARRWLTLGEACRVLGVDASTLRAWADAGRVRAFRTPGGHRRFTRDDLKALVQRGRLPRPGQVAQLIRRHGQTLVRARPVAGAPWYAALDGAARRHIRRICRTLMAALVGYLAGGARRRAHRHAGERTARQLGQTLAARGLTPAQATGAFLHYRDVMTEAATTRLALPPDQQLRSLRQVDAFLNLVLQQVMEAFEQAQPKHHNS